jgi:hypothetical protein
MSKKVKFFSFQQAAQYKLPFGPYEGKTLDDIAQTDDGLSYLDNLNGKMHSDFGDVAKALTAYLTDATIAKELEDLIDAREERFARR